MNQQIFVGLVLLGALVLFIWERWRYDVVAVLALLALTIPGIVPADEAFLGFGHPAVITVASVLVLTQALINSGLVDMLAKPLLRLGTNLPIQVIALTGITAICSAFINNVAAVALMLPLTLQIARAHDFSPSRLLMPVAYGSLLGGMTTLVGTPPNIIIASYQAQNAGASFGMFDFAPVGSGVALAGIGYIALLGWRLLPERRGQASPEDLFQISDYTTEVRVPPNSKAVGKRLNELPSLRKTQVVVAGLIRDEQRFLVPSGFTTLQAGDLLIVETDPTTLKTLLDDTGFKLTPNESPNHVKALGSDEVSIMEAVVTSDSPMVRNTVRNLDLRQRYGVNLLAVARQGVRLRARLGEIRLRAGDVLLIQGPTSAIHEMFATLRCLPLAERRLRIGQERRIWLAVGIFAAAILTATLGWLPIQVAVTSAAVVMVLARLISLREAYDAIEWPIIILLGAMIPVADALERTGGADWIAGQLLTVAGQASPAVALALVLIGAMILTPLVNNAAAAVLMAPIAISIAQRYGVAAEPFLMAAAIGVSCDFLTPIGHQSNTLVMGPGGYKFGDYWRMGLMIELLVIVVALPLLLVFWPF